ncbi:MAG: metal ABC transporter ATP-binding protein [Anaerolineales bacterium]|nr:metal ABC transporter ATP-binding protein [Anaerolineales bacterium]
MVTKLLDYGKPCDTPAIADTPALLVTGVNFSYPQLNHRVLENINLVIHPGENIALVGPNGAGKSTLIKLVAGLEKIQAGTIEVYGNPATACKHRISLVPQRSQVDWSFPVSVREVVMMGRYAHLGWVKRPRQEDHDRVEAALKRLEIDCLAERQVGDLSGGQQQRVMLARAIAHDADLLLLDEPLNHVDIATQELIFHLLEELCEQGKAAITSTHDLGILPVHFCRAVFIDRQVIADGAVDEVLTAENIARAYGFEFHKQKDLSQWLNG